MARPQFPDLGKVRRLTRREFAQMIATEVLPDGSGKHVPPAGRERIREALRHYFAATEQGREEWEASHHCRAGRSLEDVLDDLMQEVP